MVGRLLTGTQDSHDVVATSSGRQEAGHLVTLRQLKLILRVEITNHLNLILALTHLQLDRGGLALLHVEEGDLCQDTTIGHTSTCYQHVVALVHRQRLLQKATPGSAQAHIDMAATLEIQGLQTACRQHLRDGEMAVILRIGQRLDRLVGSDHLALLCVHRSGGLEIDIHPSVVFRILNLTGYRLDASRNA